jgi:hypothetical protein
MLRLRDVSPTRCLDVFVALNLAFLGVDILLAHDENGFRERAEWAPVAFSAVAPLFLAPGVLRVGPPAVRRALDLAIGIASIGVGVVGMVFRLSSAFFAERTLRSLVYSAPFLAPLAYVGVGLLLLLLRLETADAVIAEWTLLLALGGFVGNLALSLLDHAQNGFWSRLEWVPVVAAAFACSFLGVALVGKDRRMLRIALGVCALEAVVGAAGFALHVAANVRRPSPTWEARFVHGAPAFAPLLFANLALLAAIALWMLLRANAPLGRAADSR